MYNTATTNIASVTIHDTTMVLKIMCISDGKNNLNSQKAERADCLFIIFYALNARY